MKKKIVIVGATSSIAEHCARLWVQDTAVDLTLIGRNLVRTEAVAADLRVRSPKSDIHVIQANFTDPLAINATVNSIIEAGLVDLVLIAHGSLPEQSACQEDLTLCQDTLVINGVSPVLYAEAFATHLEKANHGTLAIIGSVAGDRGRKTNYVYGAAKGMVTRYVQGMQHRFATTKVKIILINPGPTDTPMTVRYKQNGMKMESVESVADQIVKAIDAGKPVAYVPAKWWLIMRIVQLIPSCIFNKLNI